MTSLLGPARIHRSTAILVSVLVLAPLHSEAQSLVARAGLGLPIEPLDARSRAMGGAGIGLSGPYLLATDPAAATGLVLPSVTASYQPARSTLTDGRSAGHARFPVVGASYPLGGSVFSAHFSGFLDQEWEIVSERVLTVSGAPVKATDTYRSTGGIGQVRIGVARRVLPPLAIGLSLGTYTGTVERAFERVLDADDVGPDVEPFVVEGRWHASGTTAALGAAWDPSPFLHLAGSASWSGDLELTPSGGTVEQRGSYQMPFELRLGGTFTLAGDLGLALGVSYADWSDTGADLMNGTTRGGTWSYGAGLEWSATTLLGRPLPLRLGARRIDLPFTLGGDTVSEQVFSGGLGLVLVQGEAMPLGLFELGIENGSRSGGAVSEDFWRTTMTIRVAGN